MRTHVTKHFWLIGMAIVTGTFCITGMSCKVRRNSTNGSAALSANANVPIEQAVDAVITAAKNALPNGYFETFGTPVEASLTNATPQKPLSPSEMLLSLQVNLELLRDLNSMNLADAPSTEASLADLQLALDVLNQTLARHMNVSNEEMEKMRSDIIAVKKKVAEGQRTDQAAAGKGTPVIDTKVHLTASEQESLSKGMAMVDQVLLARTLLHTVQRLRSHDDDAFIREISERSKDEAACLPTNGFSDWLKQKNLPMYQIVGPDYHVGMMPYDACALSLQNKSKPFLCAWQGNTLKVFTTTWIVDGNQPPAKKALSAPFYIAPEQTSDKNWRWLQDLCTDGLGVSDLGLFCASSSTDGKTFEGVKEPAQIGLMKLPKPYSTWWHGESVFRKIKIYSVQQAMSEASSSN